MIEQEIRFHPASEIFPLMEGADLEDLVQDIRKHGLREPIMLHPDGSILDGRNRYRACRQLQIEPASVIWVAVGSPLEYVLSLNLHRRHLTPSQLSMVAVKAKPLLEQEARERQLTGLKGCGKEATLAPGGAKGRADKLAGAAVGIGAEHVRCASTVVERGIPELAEAVKAGQVGVRVAAEVASLPIDEQRRLVAEGPDAIRQAAHRRRPSKPKEGPVQEAEKQEALAGIKRLPRQAAADIFRRSVQALQGICLGLSKCNTTEVLKASDARQLRDSLREAISTLKRVYAGLGGNRESH